MHVNQCSETDFSSDFDLADAKALFHLLNCHHSELPVEFYLDRFFRSNDVGVSDAGSPKCMTGFHIMNKCKSHLGGIPECKSPSQSCHHLVEQYRHCSLKKSCKSADNSTRSLALSRHQHCLDAIWPDIKPCATRMERKCSQSTTHAVKVIRARMAAIELLLSADPKVKVIHLLRDPRGMLASQLQAAVTKHKLEFVDAQSYCGRLLDDTVYRTKLETFHPDTFLQVRYEDLATEPLKWLDIIYQHLGLEVTEAVKSWLVNSTSSTSDREDHSIVNTVRRNSTKTAYSWQSKLGQQDLETILSVPECSNFLGLLGYATNSSVD